MAPQKDGANSLPCWTAHSAIPSKRTEQEKKCEFTEEKPDKLALTRWSKSISTDDVRKMALHSCSIPPANPSVYRKG